MLTLLKPNTAKNHEYDAFEFDKVIYRIMFISFLWTQCIMFPWLTLALCKLFTNLCLWCFIICICSTQVMSQSRKQTPSDFLKQIIGRPVVVKLNSGIDYRGLSITLRVSYFLC